MLALVLCAALACQTHPAPFDPPSDARVLQLLPPADPRETRDDFVIVKNALGERRGTCLVFYKSTVRVLGLRVKVDVVREYLIGP